MIFSKESISKKKKKNKKAQVGPLYPNSPLPVHRRCPRCCTTTPATTASVTVASSCCRTPACCWASASCCWSPSLSTTSIWTWTIDPDQLPHHCQGPLSHSIFRFFCAYDLNLTCDESVFCCRSPSPSSLAQLPDIFISVQRPTSGSPAENQVDIFNVNMKTGWQHLLCVKLTVLWVAFHVSLFSPIY